MQRISSNQTCWHKRLGPAVVFAILALVAAVMVVGSINQPSGLWALLMPLALAAYCVMLFHSLKLFQLADEVCWSGDRLIVRNGGKEDSFPMTNIASAEHRPARPGRIVLSLREPCRFGWQITFAPAGPFWPDTSQPLVEELVARANRPSLAATTEQRG